MRGEKGISQTKFKEEENFIHLFLKHKTTSIITDYLD